MDTAPIFGTDLLGGRGAPKLKGELAKVILPKSKYTGAVKGSARRRPDSMTSSEIESEFWSKVDKSNGPDSCWLWSGPSKTSKKKAKPGYGHFTIQHYGVFFVKSPAHVFAYKSHNKVEIPNGIRVCHRCDNPPCCNPKHLWLGTDKDNIRDAWKKGRARSNLKPNPMHGSKHPRSKLTEAAVLSIRQELAEGATVKATAIKYKVSTGLISMVGKRQVWKHV